MRVHEMAQHMIVGSLFDHSYHLNSNVEQALELLDRILKFSDCFDVIVLAENY